MKHVLQFDVQPIVLQVLNFTIYRRSVFWRLHPLFEFDRVPTQMPASLHA